MSDPSAENAAELVHLRTMLHHLDGAIAIIDGRGIIQFINNYDKAYHYLITSAAVLGSSFFELIPTEWHSMATMMMHNLEASGLPATIDLQCQGPRQSKLFFELTCKMLPNVGEAQSQYLIQVRDITPRKIFERKLESVGADMSNLIENANALIIATDNKGYITEWNKTASEITGYSRHEALMTKLSDLSVDESERTQSDSAFEELLGGQLLTNYELTVKAKNGSPLSFLINGTPKLNSGRQVIGALIVGQDVTELTAYRKSLETKVEERTHELNKSFEEIKQQKNLVDEERKKSDLLLLNILPSAVANELKEKKFVTPREYKMATILFADMVGFTQMSTKLSPDDLVYELNYIFMGYDMILEKHNLEKIKTLGDGYLAVGGLPIENETNPADAIRAAFEMISFTERIKKGNIISGKPGWEVRIGIHTGTLVAGVIGKNKFAYDVWGSSVNTASRIESVSQSGRINISEETYLKVKDRFSCTFRGEIDVKSLGNVKMYFVDKEKP